MENKDISQIALERIKEKGIKPLSRKIFSIKRVLFWTAVSASFIVGAFSFSLVLSGLFNNDWDLYNRFGFNFILKTLPYFWLLSLVMFTLLGEYYYRKTLLGHRRGVVLIIGVYLISTTVFGSVFYLIGIGNKIENSLENQSQLYRGLMVNRYQVWFHPEDGLLSGDIINVGDNEISIIDRDGTIWIINTESSIVRGRVNIDLGEKIKIIGNKIDDSIFNAEEIRPWMGGLNKKMR